MGACSAPTDLRIDEEGKPSPKIPFPSGLGVWPLNISSGFGSGYNVHVTAARSDTEKFMLHKRQLQVDSYVFVEVRA